MASIHWESLSPQDTFDTLRAAPRVAGRWEPAWVEGEFQRYPPCRKAPDGMTLVWDFNGEVVVHSQALAHRAIGAEPVHCHTREEADEVLKNAGWLLVPG